ncbi:PREDICTED: ankyrin-3-like [Acropora digitifera]|uniref:ankyrin-3-like n=1 Tax=Acropora digitifera TaxID=70779 RepID=UPI00077A01EF|nr:PREDICTED: ankyrin-3-like [Acropora digitifera]
MMSQDEVSEQVYAVQISQGQILNITLLASEWKSSAGGLSTLNRELAIHLAQIQNVRVSLFVPEGACNDEDKREARSFGISILDAKKCVGVEPLLWLSNPPQDHKIDVIVGHGVKLGCQVQFIKRHPNFENCKWVHVVHTAPEDLSKYKGYSSPISRGEEKHWDEVNLCKCADLVVPVGPRLAKAYHSYLQECKKDDDFFELIPGLFEREFGDLPAKQNPKDEIDDFIVLLCGRGDEEDFELKGYNTAVKAFADQRLKGKAYSLLFVGSPGGKQDEVRERLLKYGITDEQLTVREFVKSRERMKELFCEVDMVIMPSKSEGFGLIALEALSAGLPILVGSNSGFARAIKKIPYGKFSIVGDSGNPAKWAEAIEDVHDRHGMVLEESEILKERYSKKYCWKKQCEELVAKLWKMVYVAADDLVEQCPGAVPESICQHDPKAMQQLTEEGVVTSGTGKEGTSNDECTLLKLQWTSAAEAVAADDLILQCPTGVSESVCQSNPTAMQQHIEEGAVTSGRGQQGTSGDELTLPELADPLIKLIVETTVDLNEEQKKAVYQILMLQVSQFMEFRNYSKVKETAVRALVEFLKMAYNVSRVAVNKGSLIISLNCKTLKGLDQLWNDYLSGHLNKVAERYLVTDKMKRKLKLRKINLKTTIVEQNYLNCRKVLLESSGEADSTTLSSQRGALDQGTASMTGMSTAADDEELLVKQENTDWMIRMKKARASRSVLHKASVNGQHEKVKKYLSGGCAVDVKDQFLLTPLHLACWYGQESIVKLLLEHGADVNATDEFHFTPLHKAERRNHESIVKLLLDHKARPTLQQPPSLRTLGRRAFTRTDEHSGFNLLQAAVLEGDYDTVTKASVLLESFVEEMKGYITGEKAFTFRDKPVTKILLVRNKILRTSREFLEDEESSEMDEQFLETDVTLTKLHSCAKRSDVEMAIELVLNYGVDANVPAERNITPLLWASSAASSLSIKTLIDLGADVNAKAFVDRSCCFCGSTALYSAIHGNNAAVVKVLLANKADASIRDQQGNTALHSSTSKQLYNISQLLIDSGCKVNGSNDKGETPLYSAIRGNNIAHVQLLLKNNADANFHDTSGNTPLHISTGEGFSDISQLLINAGCKINESNDSSETPLYSAIRGNNKADVQFLLKNNADANFQDKLGNTPLHIGGDINLSNDCDMSTLLFDAVLKNNAAFVKLLLEHRTNSSIQDSWGHTPLHKAIIKGFSDISEMLIKSGCNVNLTDKSGTTPLHCSVIVKSTAIVSLLLASYADANIQDTSGNTPLHLSISKGFSEIAQLLIGAACNTNLRNQRGETPLHSAVRENDTTVVKHLLKSEADANIQDQRGNTPLHISTFKGFSDISQLLIDSGCDINLRNNRGESPFDVGPRPSPDTRS